MTIDDVIVRAAAAEEDDRRLRVVLLREREGPRVLPIWIGALEGDALAFELGGEWKPLSAADVRAAWEARMPK